MWYILLLYINTYGLILLPHEAACLSVQFVYLYCVFKHIKKCAEIHEQNSKQKLPESAIRVSLRNCLRGAGQNSVVDVIGQILDWGSSII